MLQSLLAWKLLQVGDQLRTGAAITVTYLEPSAMAVWIKIRVAEKRIKGFINHCVPP